MIQISLYLGLEFEADNQCDLRDAKKRYRQQHGCYLLASNIKIGWPFGSAGDIFCDLLSQLDEISLARKPIQAFPTDKGILCFQRDI